MELFTASPEFQDFPGSDFLTSPMDDSPWEELLTTPALGTGDDLLTSPAIVDADDFGFGNGSLFTDFAAAAVSAAPVEPIKPVPRPPLPFDSMYTISPNTPSLDPSSLHPSPAVPQDHSPASSASRRKNAPTGTRKNITPEALVPYDAPIQPRKYLTPSATSRKEVPAVFAKKRARSQAFGEEDEAEDGASLNLSEMDAIEAKRRQNTLAARRSRKRKLEYQRELEISIEREKEEKEVWKQKALFYETLLKHHGLEAPPYP
jgi:hypothetical protein